MPFSVPKLFTMWLLSQYRDDPGESPTLPSYLRHLIHDGTIDLPRPESDLPPEVWIAANLIWAEFRPIIEAMLFFFHSQPTQRNRIIHQPPTTADATQVVASSTDIPAPIQNLAQAIIYMGRRKEDWIWVLLFTGATPSRTDGEFDAQVVTWAAGRKYLF